MNKYNVTFRGTLAGSLGLQEDRNINVLANNPMQAQMKVYEKYDHISKLIITDIKTGRVYTIDSKELKS